MKTTEQKLNITLLTTRVVLGTVIAAHGAQKLLGWFGGFGFDGTMAFFTETIGLPLILALLIILLESIGMVLLIIGFTTRLMASALIIVMLGAIVTSHYQYFFMNWFGMQQGEGFEFHLLTISLSFILVIHGAGAYSVDAILKPFARLSDLNKIWQKA